MEYDCCNIALIDVASDTFFSKTSTERQRKRKSFPPIFVAQRASIEEIYRQYNKNPPGTVGTTKKTIEQKKYTV